MTASRYIVKVTSLFRKDYKRAMKRGLNVTLLEHVVGELANGRPLPAKNKDHALTKNKDHALTGEWAGYRECHVQPDWLLVYCIEDDVLVLTLTRTGTHSDIFGR